MRKSVSVLLILFIVFFVISPVISATTEEKIQKLQNEISVLDKKLDTTKSKIEIARIKRTIKGHQAKIDELKKSLPEQKPVVSKETSVLDSSKLLIVKAGSAGGAVLIGVDALVPMGAWMLGGEAGYAIGDNFGILDLGLKGVYSFGDPFLGVEVLYAGYSKDVKNVPGLSGVVKSGVGFGVSGGTFFGPVRVSVGYNTALGLRADAGYKLKF